MIVKVFEVPVQDVPPLMNTGVTVMVADTGEVPVLIAVNDGMSPEPLPESPMLVVLFVQVYVVRPPVLLVLKVTTADEPP